MPDRTSAAQKDAVSILYRYQWRTAWFSAIAAVVMAAVMSTHVPTLLLVAWLALCVAVTGWRVLRIRAGLRAPEFGRHPRADERRVALWVAVNASLLPLPLLLYGHALPVDVVHALGLAVVALGGGAAATMLSSRIAFIAYAVPLLGLTAIAHFRLADSWFSDINTLLGVTFLVFAQGIIYVHGGMHRCLLNTLAMRQEKESILREKEALLMRLEMDNAELLADRDAFLIESLTDSLTGLANRRHFDKTLVRDWERARREGMCLSCIMLDVDHFKPYNDRHGHGAGDETLKAVAEAIRAGLNRGSDFAARYGGEEFVILLPGTDLEGSALLAERIRSAIAQMDFVGEERLTVSAGVASVTPAGGEQSAELLLEMADHALYKAKAQGRNKVVAHREQGRGSRMPPTACGPLPDPA